MYVLSKTEETVFGFIKICKYPYMIIGSGFKGYLKVSIRLCKTVMLPACRNPECQVVELLLLPKSTDIYCEIFS